MHLLLLALIVAASLNCMEKWEITKTFKQPKYNVHAIAFNQNAKTLAMASDDIKSHLFNIELETEIQSFNNYKNTQTIDIHNTLVATGSNVINAVTKKVNHSFNNTDVIVATKFNHTGQQLAVTTKNTLSIYDLLTNTLIRTIQQQDPPVSLCFDQENNQIIAASLNKVCIFDLRGKQTVKAFYRTNRYIASVSTNAANEIVTVETPGDTIQIYNDLSKEIIDTNIAVTVKQGNNLNRFYNGETLFSTCFHPEKKLLALALFGKALMLSPNNQK